jgi:hypothetical protein
MQTQVTLRPTRGLSFQTSYTWSRNLSDSNPNDWTTGKRQYYLSGQNRSHQLTTYGTFDMPMGANGFILRNASGLLKKAVEGWQLSWVGSLTSGMPASMTGSSTFWGDSNVDLVAPELFDRKGGKVSWVNTPNSTGRYFGDLYQTVVDMDRCSVLATDLYNTCAGIAVTNGVAGKPTASSAAYKAIALVSDPTKLVFRNALPMTHGNFRQNELTGPGRWSLDMTMGKSIEFMEGKRIEFKLDAQNIFNHATPSGSAIAGSNARYVQVDNPGFSLSSFGILNSKGGHRTFQAKIRISF